MTAAALAAAAAFNLICTGTTTFRKLDLGPDDRTTQFSEVFRVDLSQKRWCYRECTSTNAFVEITPTRLVFEREDRGAYDDTVTFVNRENGVFASRIRSGIIGSAVFVTLMEGTCVRAKFTGFPAIKF